MFESSVEPIETTDLKQIKQLSRSMVKIIPAGGISKQAI